MSPVTMWAVAALAVSGSAMAVRARMLRPSRAEWIHAPPLVWIGLSVLALAQLASAVALAFGGRANIREASIYTLLALVAVVMLVNLNRNGRRAYVERQRFEAEARAAIKAAGPPARYLGEDRLGQRR